MSKEIEKIASDIELLIEKRAKELSYDDTKWKEHYESVMESLESEIQETDETIKDYTESNLNFNTVEQEGYLRALKTMVNKFRHWEKHLAE